MATTKWDPWVLLSELAKGGLSSVAVDLTFEGAPARLTDQALEQAITGEFAPGLEPASVRAALAIVEIDPPRAAVIVERARAGDAWAQQTYEAIVLRELVRYRTRARKLVADLARKDPRARRVVEWLIVEATRPGPGQSRARVVAWLVRDAMRELAAAREAKPSPAGETSPDAGERIAEPNAEPDVDEAVPTKSPPAPSAATTADATAHVTAEGSA